MAFFKFRNNNKQDSSKSQEVEAPVASTVIQSTATIPEKKETPVYAAPVNKKKKENEDIKDFFSVDIYNIFKYDAKPVADNTYDYAVPVEVYSFQPRDLELSTFYKIDIIKFENGHYDLVFLSNINEIRNDLKEFVEFCMKYFGPDFMNKGSINDRDLRDVPLGVFSRIWYNNLRIENMHFAISMTLYDITPNK